MLTFNITPEVTEFLRRLQRGKHERPGLLHFPTETVNSKQNHGICAYLSKAI